MAISTRTVSAFKYWCKCVHLPRKFTSATSHLHAKHLRSIWAANCHDALSASVIHGRRRTWWWGRSFRVKWQFSARRRSSSYKWLGCYCRSTWTYYSGRSKLLFFWPCKHYLMKQFLETDSIKWEDRRFSNRGFRRFRDKQWNCRPPIGRIPVRSYPWGGATHRMPWAAGGRRTS